MAENIIPFPREVIVDQKIRTAERLIERNIGYIENCDPNSASVEERVQAATAPRALEWAQEDLRAAMVEKATLNVDDAMRYGGIVYRAYPSQRGAH